jgi:hypothetical protein
MLNIAETENNAVPADPLAVAPAMSAPQWPHITRKRIDLQIINSLRDALLESPREPSQLPFSRAGKFSGPAHL